MRSVVPVVASQGSWVIGIQGQIACIVLDSVLVSKERAEVFLQLPASVDIEQVLEPVQIGFEQVIIQIVVPGVLV